MTLKRILSIMLVIILLFSWTMGISYYSYSKGWDDGSNRVINQYNKITEQLKNRKKIEEPQKMPKNIIKSRKNICV